MTSQNARSTLQRGDRCPPARRQPEASTIARPGGGSRCTRPVASISTCRPPTAMAGRGQVPPHREHRGVGGAAADVDRGHLLVVVHRPARDARSAPGDLRLGVGAGDRHDEVPGPARTAPRRIASALLGAGGLAGDDHRPGLDRCRARSRPRRSRPAPARPARPRRSRRGRSAGSRAPRRGRRSTSRPPGSAAPDPARATSCSTRRDAAARGGRGSRTCPRPAHAPRPPTSSTNT